MSNKAKKSAATTATNTPAAYPLSVKVGFLVAALVSLCGAYQFYSFETEYQQLNQDPYKIADQFSRFDQFKNAVPESAVLGYLTDLAPDSVAANAMFNGAQYVLAPRLLERAALHDLVLGNFARPGDFAAVGRSRGLRIERDFGNGVVLFQKEAR